MNTWRTAEDIKIWTNGMELTESSVPMEIVIPLPLFIILALTVVLEILTGILLLYTIWKAGMCKRESKNGEDTKPESNDAGYSDPYAPLIPTNSASCGVIYHTMTGGKTIIA